MEEVKVEAVGEDALCRKWSVTRQADVVEGPTGDRLDERMVTS